MVCLHKIQVYLTQQIYVACEWLVNSFLSLIADLHDLPLEMKITLDLLFVNFDKCDKTLWCVYNNSRSLQTVTK
jgi:hypothetical protein